MNDLAYKSASEIRELIRTGEVGCLELVDHLCSRIDSLDGHVNALAVDLREQALDVAARLDNTRKDERAPLFGVPVTVKESFNVAGAPTTWGNPEWTENVATDDAVCVRRLKQSGAIILGKTNVAYMLADCQTYNDVYGTTNNPYDLSRGVGGSSGGSAAAIASGFSALDIGSDIGGSIRSPAHYCGVFGHKPTWNLICNRGHSVPGDHRALSDISVIGPIARSASDLELAVKTLMGRDDIESHAVRFELPRLRQGPSQLRVAVWANDPIAPVDSLVEKHVRDTARLLAELGAQVDFDARPSFSAHDARTIFSGLVSATMSYTRTTDKEFRALVDERRAMLESDRSARAEYIRARTISFREWKSLDEARNKMRWQWRQFFDEYDVLLTPVMATPAFPHDHNPAFSERSMMVDGNARPYFEQTFWAGLTGACYLPSTVAPTGLNSAGLPIGVQIAGPEYGDLLTIEVAAMLERAGSCFVAPQRLEELAGAER